MYELYISANILSEGEWKAFHSQLIMQKIGFETLEKFYIIGEYPLKSEFPL